jgi:predicted nucleic acid-binding protein
MKLTTEDTEDTERAAPETDAKVSGHIGFYSCATVPAELCRRMERERDEARRDLEFRRELYKVQEQYLETAKRERDEARDIIRKAIMKFSEDDSDGRIAAAMLAILSKKEPVS